MRQATGLPVAFLYLLAGTHARSHPKADATFNNVSSWGVVFLLSKRAITDCVRQATCANSFCVIPRLCRCSISKSMIAAQFSGTENTPYRNAIDIAAVWAKVNFIAPYFLAVNVWVNVPRYAMGVIYIDSAEVL